MMTPLEHIPVMLKEVLECLAPKAGGVYVDCTFGAGGYSRAILRSNPLTLYALDQDPDVLPFVHKTKDEFSEESSFHFIQDNFANLKNILKSMDITKVDGIVLDLGVSSIQVDRAERGFSFQKEAKLDMRMSQDGYSAYDFINEADEQTLSNVIYLYGDEKKSRKIARSIVDQRKIAPIETTTQLADIVRKICIDKRQYKQKIDPSTKTFQAIRIYINKELEALEAVLNVADEYLSDQGRLVVVSFHSLEDRIVKQFFQNLSKQSNNSRYFSDMSLKQEFKPHFKVLTKKPLLPTDQEVLLNVRARSAKLRAAERVRGGLYEN
jgi:16S rRNA (cytosine1402-N4)-methyltransferase